MSVANVREFFEAMIPAKLAAGADWVEKIGAVYRFDIEGDDSGTWLVDLTAPGGSVCTGDLNDEADCVVAMKAEDFLESVALSHFICAGPSMEGSFSFGDSR